MIDEILNNQFEERNLGKSNLFSESKMSSFGKLKINLFMYIDMLLLVLR